MGFSIQSEVLPEFSLMTSALYLSALREDGSFLDQARKQGPLSSYYQYLHSKFVCDGESSSRKPEKKLAIFRSLLTQCWFGSLTFPPSSAHWRACPRSSQGIVSTRSKSLWASFVFFHPNMLNGDSVPQDLKSLLWIGVLDSYGQNFLF